MREYLIYYAIKFGGDQKKILTAIEKKERINKEQLEKVVMDLKCKVVTIFDDNYPSKLKEIYCPPLVLFYYGDISLVKQKSIGIIGARNVSDEGVMWTKYFTSELVKKKLVVVSGLAKGVDGIAHQSAIESGGKTIAVLGSGIDYCYPSENKYLYEIIKKNHLLISEYPLKTRPHRHHFPLRNRIVSSLSDKLLISEAGIHSGTMITANWSLESGKDVYCIPSMDQTKKGCNYLIKQGAILADEINDFFI